MGADGNSHHARCGGGSRGAEEMVNGAGDPRAEAIEECGHQKNLE